MIHNPFAHERLKLVYHLQRKRDDFRIVCDFIVNCRKTGNEALIDDLMRQRYTALQDIAVIEGQMEFLQSCSDALEKERQTKTKHYDNQTHFEFAS